jgi:hypothetical protein
MDDALPQQRTAAPVDHLPSRRPFSVDQPRDSARNQLVRYFAWGYLSRREVNERLRMVDHETVDGSQRRPTDRAA